MSEIKISESRIRGDYISYILNSLSSVMAEMRASKILKTDCNFVELLAIKYSPFSAISKYMQMGFRSIGGDNFFENMSINRERMTKALSQTKELIKLEPITNAPEEDLLKTLKLPE